LTTLADPPARDCWARLRFLIIGPLLAAPPIHGALQEAFRTLAAKSWRHPLTDQDIHFSVSCLERWYYAAKKAQDPLAILRNQLRDDRGRFHSFSPTAIATLAAQYQEHPGWTMQLHADNLWAALRLLGSDSPLPSYPSVRRYLIAHGMHRQARPKRATAGALLARDRLEQREVRSFEVDHVGALWHLDFHHGACKVLTPSGEWRTPMLLGVIDDRSRLVCHLQWYLDETAQSLVHGLSQAFMKRGLPRALMTDNGAAMIAEETTTGLARLGILHQTTLPYSPYQNAKQESFWGRIEGRLIPMLESEAALTLAMLNQATQAWVEQEYHRTLHSELQATPLERYLAGPTVSRPCPGSAELAAAFRIEVTRRQRRSAYRHLTSVAVRYARWDLSRVDLVDARADVILSPLFPLDKSANADGRRRALVNSSATVSPAPTSGGTSGGNSGIAPLLQQLIAEYAATGLPPAYLPVAGQEGV